MRIAYDATPLLGPRTGIGWYTADLVDAVARAAPDDELLLLPVTWRRARLVPRPAHPNVRVLHRFAPARPLRALWRRVPFPPLEWLADCDVFHATNFVAPPARRVPTVVTVHDVGFVRHPEMVEPAIHRMAELLPSVLRRSAAIITVSQFTKDELCEWLPEVADRITVVHNGGHRRPGVADGAAAVGDDSDDEAPYALMLGLVEPRKNVGLALDALQVLRDRGSDLRLVLAGGSSPLLDVKDMLASRGLRTPDVVPTGYVADARAASLLRRARLFVFPSLYEGFGMPLVEAMEAGVPIVAVRAGATPEVVGDAAVLVEPGDTVGFADAMARVATDDALRSSLVRAGKARAAQLSWERAGAATLKVYRQVANR